MKKILRWIVIAAAATLLLAGYLVAPLDTEENAEPAPSGTLSPTSSPALTSPARTSNPAPAPAPQAADGIKRRVENVAIKNYDKVVFRGTVDLTASIDRIRAGIKHPHRNDGSVFGNRERLLPSRQRGYYREYVHPTENISGPGPQRLVVGRDGDWWYTPDHYASFIPLGNEKR